MSTAIIERLRKGGAIFSSATFTPTEIAIARANDRMFVDDCGFGYIYENRTPPQVKVAVLEARRNMDGDT